MMEQLTDEEIYLLMGKATGTLAEDEEALADRLLLEHPHAQDMYAHAIASYGNLQEAPQWVDLREQLTARTATAKETPPRRMAWRWAAAAAIALLITASYLLWKPTTNEQADHPQIATAKPGISLQLSTGETIDLSAQAGDINIGDLRLSNTGNTLSYSGTTGRDAAGRHTLTVPVGLDYQITLADGSTVWLNSATRLDFPTTFAGDTREIQIDGEAYLAVAKDADRPFIVHLPESRVEVLGTEFNVNTYDGTVEKVALVSGVVRLFVAGTDQEDTEASRSLLPGQLGTHAQGQPLAVSTFDARDLLSWREGRYHFREATLDEISRVVPRWYGTQVAIGRSANRNRKFTGVIDRRQPLSVFQDDLKAISGIDSHVDANGVLHIGQ